MNLWYDFVKTILHVLISLFYDLRIYGRENVPEKGGVLLVSNHQSFLDPPLCGMSFTRDCDYMARETLFDNPVFGALIRSLNAFPVTGGQGDIRTIKRLIERLQNQRMVTIFPEGNRSYDGKMGKMRSGFELIARKGKAMTIPVAIDGAYEAMPRGKTKINMGASIRIKFGEPIPYEQIKELGRDGYVAEVTKRIQEMQKELRVELGKEPFDYS